MASGALFPEAPTGDAVGCSSTVRTPKVPASAGLSDALGRSGSVQMQPVSQPRRTAAHPGSTGCCRICWSRSKPAEGTSEKRLSCSPHETKCRKADTPAIGNSRGQGYEPRPAVDKLRHSGTAQLLFLVSAKEGSVSLCPSPWRLTSCLRSLAVKVLHARLRPVHAHLYTSIPLACALVC